MATAIPTYEKRFSITQDLPTARAQSAVSANSPVADALVNLGNTGMGIEARMAARQDEEKKKALDRTENVAAVEVSNILSSSEPYWQQQIDEKTKAWKVGDPDLRESVGRDFDKWQNENMAKLPTDKSREYFSKQAGQIRAKQLMGVYAFQEKATTGKLNAESAAGEQADENTVYASPERFNEVFKRRMEPMIARTDLTEAEKIKSADLYKRRLSLAAERGEAALDPVGWYKRRFGAYARPGMAGTTGISAGADSIANAIYGQESGSGAADTSRFNSQNVTGPMQIQQGTFDGMKKLGIIPDNYDIKNPDQNKDAGFRWVGYLSQKYNNDPAKVAAAYYGGEKAVSVDGTINRAMKNLSRPTDPTVGQYVDQVVGRIQKAGGVQVAAAGGVASDAGSGMPEMPKPPATYGDIDYEQQIAIKTQVQTAMLRTAQQQDAKAKQLQIDAEKEFKAASTVLEAGKALEPRYASQLLAKYKGTPYEGAIQSLMVTGPEAMSFVASPVGQQAAQILSLQAQMNMAGASPESLQRYERLDRAHKATLADIKADPYKAAVERGVLASVSVLPERLQDIPAQLAQRANEAQAITSWTGEPTSLFRPAEAEKVTSMLMGLPPKDRAAALQNLSTSMQPAQMREFAKQLGGKDDTLAAAAILSSQNARTSNGRLVSEIIIAGADAQKEGRVKWPPGAAQIDVRQEIDKATRGAFLSENAQRAAGDAALSIYAGLLAEGSSPNVKQVVQLATGGIMDMNGQKFVKPWGMTDSAVMASLRSFDAPKIASLIGNGRARVGGQPVTADELARYMPGAQLGPSPKPGFYTVSIGGRLVSGEDGKPMFIPIGGSDVR